MAKWSSEKKCRKEEKRLEKDEALKGTRPHFISMQKSKGSFEKQKKENGFPIQKLPIG